MNSFEGIEDKNINVLHIVMNPVVHDNRLLKETVSLKKQGYRTAIIALHDSSHNLPSYENYQDVDIYRIKLVSKKWPKLRIIQLLKYLEYLWQGYQVIKQVRPIVLHCHDLSTLAFSFLNRRHYSHLIYDSHEFHYGRSQKRTRFFVACYEKFLLKFCHHLITVSDSIVRALTELHKIKNLPISTIQNVPLLTDIKAGPYLHLKEEFQIDRSRKLLLFLGAITEKRGGLLYPVLLAYLPNTHLVFMGQVSDGFRNKMVALSQQYGTLEQIHFKGPVSQHIMISIASTADAGILIYPNICENFYFSLPNKIFEYIHAGLPVICSDFPEYKKIINKYKVGLTVDYQGRGLTVEHLSLKGVAKKICSLLSDDLQLHEMKINTILARQQMCWQREEKKLIGIYASFLNPS